MRPNHAARPSLTHAGISRLQRHGDDDRHQQLIHGVSPALMHGTPAAFKRARHQQPQPLDVDWPVITPPIHATAWDLICRSFCAPPAAKCSKTQSRVKGVRVDDCGAVPGAPS
jgi:hypothetical protein